MLNTEKSLDQIVRFVRAEALSIREAKSTADLQIHGTTVHSA